MDKLIARAFETAIVLAITGQLGSATLAMMRHAAEAQQTGLISLTALNHQLMDHHPAKHKR
jgi:hypothetical protein